MSLRSDGIADEESKMLCRKGLWIAAALGMISGGSSQGFGAFAHRLHRLDETTKTGTWNLPLLALFSL